MGRRIDANPLANLFNWSEMFWTRTELKFSSKCNLVPRRQRWYRVGQQTREQINRVALFSWTGQSANLQNLSKILIAFVKSPIECAVNSPWKKLNASGSFDDTDVRYSKTTSTRLLTLSLLTRSRCAKRSRLQRNESRQTFSAWSWKLQEGMRRLVKARQQKPLDFLSPAHARTASCQQW